MNYVYDAEVALTREISALEHADPSVEVPWALMQLYLTLLLVKGHAVTCEDVHNAWAVWRVGQNRSNTASDYLVPFNELSPEIQAYDVPFRDAIRRAALRVWGIREEAK